MAANSSELTPRPSPFYSLYWFLIKKDNSSGLSYQLSSRSSSVATIRLVRYASSELDSISVLNQCHSRKADAAHRYTYGIAVGFRRSRSVPVFCAGRTCTVTRVRRRHSMREHRALAYGSVLDRQQSQTIVVKDIQAYLSRSCSHESACKSFAVRNALHLHLNSSCTRQLIK